MNIPYNIVLCGFMGCGKSTVGKKLARRLELPFIDMDAYIERQAGMTVSQLFDRYGEAHFRDLEHQCCVELSKQGGNVVATGGGALTFPRNQEALKQNGTIVLLDPPFPIIKRRLSGDTTRPLLNQPNREKAMDQLYRKRLPVYRAAADLVVPAKGSPGAVCREIMEALGLRIED